MICMDVPLQGAKLHTRSIWRRALDGLMRWLSGSDVFISYGGKDGHPYAEALRKELRKRGYVPYIDTLDQLPADTPPPKIYNRLYQSSMLVVVGTQAAMESTWVDDEIRRFLTTRRSLLVVQAMHGQTERSRWREVVEKGKPPIIDPKMASGEPSEQVMERIVGAMDFLRQERRRILWLMVALAVIGLLALFSGVQGQDIQVLRDQKVNLGKEVAQVEERFAEETRKATEATLAASKAEAEADAARNAELAAIERRNEALTRADEAYRSKALAEDALQKVRTTLNSTMAELEKKTQEVEQVNKDLDRVNGSLERARVLQAEAVSQLQATKELIASLSPTGGSKPGQAIANSVVPYLSSESMVLRLAMETITYQNTISLAGRRNLQEFYWRLQQERAHGFLEQPLLPGAQMPVVSSSSGSWVGGLTDGNPTLTQSMTGAGFVLSNGHGSPLAIAFSEDDKFGALAFEDGTIEVWALPPSGTQHDASIGGILPAKATFSTNLPGRRAREMQISEGQSALLFGDESGWVLFSLKEGTEKPEQRASGAGRASLSPDGASLVTVTQGSEGRLDVFATNAPLELKASYPGAWPVEDSPQFSWGSMAGDPSIALWSPGQLAVYRVEDAHPLSQASAREDQEIRSVAFSGNCFRVALYSRESEGAHSVRFLPLEAGSYELERADGPSFYSDIDPKVAFLKAAPYASVSAPDRSVAIQDLEKGYTLANLPNRDDIESLSWKGESAPGQILAGTSVGSKGWTPPLPLERSVETQRHPPPPRVRATIRWPSVYGQRTVVSVWDPVDGSTATHRLYMNREAEQVPWSDGRGLFLVGERGKLTSISLQGARSRNLGCENPRVFTLRNQDFWICGSMITRFDPVSLEAIGTAMPCLGACEGALVGPDRSALVWSREKILLIGPNQKLEIEGLNVPGTPTSWALDRQRGLIAISSVAGVHLLNLKTNANLRTWRHGKGQDVVRLDFDQNGLEMEVRETGANPRIIVEQYELPDTQVKEEDMKTWMEAWYRNRHGPLPPARPPP